MKRYLLTLSTFMLISFIFTVVMYLSGYQVHRGLELAGISMLWGLCESVILPFVYFAPN